MDTKQPYIFLSYRSLEAGFALRLAAQLLNAGVNIWMDRLNIKTGENWNQEIHKAQASVPD
ncbi:MAG: toll/interleukin-1 receptor domain-containing protein [Chloroflexi bacterium]|nr:toll/interleukin-1 receptor domain-containing protein [Chloroflexota bacterium]